MPNQKFTIMTDPVLSHLAQDPQLKTLISRVVLPELNLRPDIYFDLLDSITSQQLSTKAAATIFNRFLDIFPNRYPQPDQLLATSLDQLRAVGLSRQKSTYLWNVAEYFQQAATIQINWELQTDEAIIQELTQIKGVGKWTVEMILIFSLGRPDVFPVDDLGIQQGIIKLYGLTETGRALKQKMHEIAAPWSPFRSFASRYIWRYKDGNI